jgi:hypothetical protein
MAEAGSVAVSLAMVVLECLYHDGSATSECAAQATMAKFFFVTFGT